MRAMVPSIFSAVSSRPFDKMAITATATPQIIVPTTVLISIF